MGKRNKDLEPSFAGNTDLGPALGDYSALENLRQNCTFFGVVKGVENKDFRFVAEETVIFNGNRELCWISGC